MAPKKKDTETKRKCVNPDKKMGRPPIQNIEYWKQLYLDLLAAGKTEAEVDVVDGMPSWFIRYGWQDDQNFYTHRKKAQANGALKSLSEAERILSDTYSRALDEAASPQLVSISDKIAHHARWKVGRLVKDFSEKVAVESQNTNVNMNMDVDEEDKAILKRFIKQKKDEL